MIKVKVEKLQKSFGSLEVLKGIDLEVKEGEVVCLIGPSGSGKSTFLRCLNRLEETTAGTVIVDDNDITDPKCNINKVRENIGMVFQQFNLLESKTVFQNVLFCLYPFCPKDARVWGLNLQLFHRNITLRG